MPRRPSQSGSVPRYHANASSLLQHLGSQATIKGRSSRQRRSLPHQFHRTPVRAEVESSRWHWSTLFIAAVVILMVGFVIWSAITFQTTETTEVRSQAAEETAFALDVEFAQDEELSFRTSGVVRSRVSLTADTRDRTLQQLEIELFVPQEESSETLRRGSSRIPSIASAATRTGLTATASGRDSGGREDAIQEDIVHDQTEFRVRTLVSESTIDWEVVSVEAGEKEITAVSDTCVVDAVTGLPPTDCVTTQTQAGWSITLFGTILDEAALQGRTELLELEQPFSDALRLPSVERRALYGTLDGVSGRIDFLQQVDAPPSAPAATPPIESFIETPEEETTPLPVPVDVIEVPQAQESPSSVPERSQAQVVCGDIYRPVCGEDGETYANECLARQNSVSVQRLGECS